MIEASKRLKYIYNIGDHWELQIDVRYGSAFHNRSDRVIHVDHISLSFSVPERSGH